jgi:hypothetical protein
MTTDHFFQWDDNISLVSMGGQQITCFNGRTTDNFSQSDDSISLFTMGWQHITSFNWMTTDRLLQSENIRYFFQCDDTISRVSMG